ncbi:hypothetical protein ZEAMMB73_Zm00001d004806 [Zea mays]|uniref:Uncharacterized protein n=1 Tax=Zea mays TaxID=4577 RepID=A0A1D6EHK4_MAIZE|nr:hypothetical protein ZEAMMB73_Zm00001d004806 [Zea mays]
MTRSTSPAPSRSWYPVATSTASSTMASTTSPTGTPRPPLKFAEYFNVTHGVFSYNQIGNVPPAVNGPLHVIPNVITAELHLFDQF